MSKVVIQIDQISKLYRLGEVGTGALYADLQRWWSRQLGKEDPFAKIGTINDRTLKGESDYVWALNDVSFEVRQGEVMGIIGMNGAGKSTLLKILSKVTKPTKGAVRIKGKVASLLEVGTGFHPDLTGRENIFLNGAILGMNKREIKDRFDEIVDFAGVEKYVDTPVKRYSSGMYVRLAFAVAAHLEPDILIVDEVLAVGDIEFQNKCLGKMQQVSSQNGRTVLFVSHNIGSINQLCNRSVLLEKGGVSLIGETQEVLDAYLLGTSLKLGAIYERNSEDEIDLGFLKVMSSNSFGEMKEEFYTHEEISITVHIKGDPQNEGLELALSLYDKVRNRIFTIHENLIPYYSAGLETIKLIVTLPSGFLTPGRYSWLMCINHPGVGIIDLKDSICSFRVLDGGSGFSQYEEGSYGVVFANYQVKKIS